METDLASINDIFQDPQFGDNSLDDEEIFSDTISMSSYFDKNSPPYVSNWMCFN